VELSGAEPDSSATGLLSVPVRDDVLMPAVVARLTAAGLRVDELALRRSSLEVFLTLTGHREATNDAESDGVKVGV
jgi:hypothetical protein